MNTTTPAIIEDRLQGLFLKTGLHRAPGTPENPNCELCAMEAAAYIRGFRHSDREEHASPIIGAIVRPWNDRVDDETRQQLLPLLDRIGISRSPVEVERARAWFFLDFYMRTLIPGLIEYGEEPEWAARFRALPKIHDENSARQSRVLFSEFRKFLATPSTSPAPSSLIKKRLRDDIASAIDIAIASAIASASAIDIAIASAIASAIAIAIDIDIASAIAIDIASASASAIDIAIAIDIDIAIAIAIDIDIASAIAIDIASARKDSNRLVFLPTLEAIKTALDITE